MPNCSPSTLLITKSSNKGTNSTCNNFGPADCLEGYKLSPRPNRGKVIEQLKDYVLLMLGGPVVDIELDEQMLDLAVKQTLKIMEYYAPSEYFSYYTFSATPGKSIYEMPADVGYVRNVFYRRNSEFAFTAQDLGGAIPVEYFYPGGAYSSVQGGLIDPIQPIWGRMGEWHLYKQYERTYSRLSSQLGGWQFVGGYKHIKLYPMPSRAHQVIVHYIQKCHDWNEVTLVMQEGALAHSKMMLGMIRKKYQNLPGPGGGIVTDGVELYNEGKEDYKQWKEDLVNKYGDIPPISLG